VFCSKLFSDTEEGVSRPLIKFAGNTKTGAVATTEDHVLRIQKDLDRLWKTAEDTRMAFHVEKCKAAPGGPASEGAMEGSAAQPSENRLARKYTKINEPIRGTEPPVFILPLSKGVGSPSRKHLGEENFYVHTKAIMVMGATGAGKSTLINAMVNYVLGVQWGDPFRFELVDETSGRKAESQTLEVTAYVLNHQEGFCVPFSLIIIDTPGFGSTGGMEEDKVITKKIQEFFSAPGGVDQIEAVCFVVQASSARLTENQKYVFDSVLSIFGKDIRDNIQVLVTFADGEKPPVLETLKAAGVPCAKDASGAPVHFTFNNSALFAHNGTESGSKAKLNGVFWEVNTENMKKFFDSLNNLETRSLTLTKEVLRERRELETALAGLRPQINIVLVKLKELRKTQEALDAHKEDMAANRNFTFEVETIKPVRKDTDQDANNCSQCHFTCCHPCRVPWDRLNRLCFAIGLWSGTCNVCPGRCSQNHHSLQKYRFTYEVVKEERTFEDVKKKYEAASGEVMSAEKLLQSLSQECEEAQAGLQGLIEKATRSIQRLQEIALLPNPLSMPQYVDLLIKEQGADQKPGFEGRIQLLEEAREVAEAAQKKARNEGWLRTAGKYAKRLVGLQKPK
ncbi:uncharacterized protein LOC123033036, partial [Varanus komodoensis]|uniref:uncharacterized protein LOC123033036 n=1 Tax=Varanus komodoensis TaxID=61221 RepID=UPI001CF7C0CB